MRAGLYARVSTDRQAERYGIPSQVEALKQRCRERGWEIVPDGDREAFIDDGYTGSELNRPALGRLREAARKGLADVVLAYDPDRLSRRLSHQMLLADEFEREGVKLEFITQEVGDTPEHRMFFHMRGVFAEYEREKIKERTARGRREKARQGKIVNPRAVPLGYRYDRERQTFVEDPEKAPVLRLIFYTFAQENLSLQALADRLNRLQVPTPGGASRWRASTLGEILRNEAYIGRLHQFRRKRVEPKRRKRPGTGKGKATSDVLRPRAEWITATIPALMPPELFETAQRKLERNAHFASRNTRRQYLLAGLVRCGLCGGGLGGHTIRGQAYYRCYRTRPANAPLGPDGRPRVCSCPEVKAEAIEPVVWETVSGLLQDPDFLISELRRRREDSSETKQVLERELELCEERLQGFPREEKMLVEGYRKGLYPDFLMREEMTRIQQERADIEKRKAELERRLSLLCLDATQEELVRALADRIGANLHSLDFSQKQQVLRLLVERVCHRGSEVEISTVIPLGEQLHPPHREGARG